jgi:uncharacterized membrane protein
MQPRPRPAPAPIAADSGHIAGIIEDNIRTIIELRQRALACRSTEERLADGITAFSGRMSFLYLHAVWFGIWIALNLGLFGLKAFDPFPFGLLTMIVSLEAIFLATFVLISQNRSAAESDHRADLDLQINLLTEHEVTRIIRMLDAIQTKLGIENDNDGELPQLEQNVGPQEVLQEMDIAQHRTRRAQQRG